MKKVCQEVDASEGRGVCWEANIIYVLLYETKLNTTKFLPVIFSPADKQFIPLILRGKDYLVIDSQSGYERLYAFLTEHRFPEPGRALRTIAQKTVKPLFASVGEPDVSDRTDRVSAKAMPTGDPQLTLKPDTPPAPRQEIRGLDWYDECDAGHFMERSEDADRILAMLLSRPIVRLVGPSGVGKKLPMAPGIRYRTDFPSLQHFQQRDKLPRETIPMKLTWHGHSAFRIGAGAAKILIDPFLSDNPSWDKGWIGYRAGENSTQGGNR